MATPLLDRITARKAPEPQDQRRTSKDTRPAWVRRMEDGQLQAKDMTGRDVAL